MEWLEAAVAFAVIMIVLSTMVSVLTETFHRILRLREDGLTRMVTALYEQVVQPRLAGQLAHVGATANGFVAQVTSTRYRPWRTKQARWNWLTSLLNVLARFVPGTVNAEKLKSLSTLEFVERFAETPAGQALLQETKQRGDDFKRDFLKDLVSKYEAFGENASDYFARRVRLTSVLVSFVLAFALSISVVELFQTLLTDKGVRDAWVAKGEDVAAQWESQQAELQAFLAQTDSANKPTPEEAEALIKANVQELKNSTASLKESGLPIGWKHRPWASDEWNRASCGAGDSWSSDGCFDRAGRLFRWLLAVLLSGLLIGLGGPLWFDIYRKLGALTGIVRGFQSATQQAKEPGAKPLPGAAPAQTREDIVTDVFDTAAKGHAMGLPAGRSVLATDGSLDKGRRS